MISQKTTRNSIRKYGSLSERYPEVAAEWNYEKNGKLTPDNVAGRSNKPVWWRCIKGHEWKAAPNTRITGCGCPQCSKEISTSFPEQVIYYYVQKAFPDVINRYKLNGKVEIDIYIPCIKVGIEYDGVAFHSNKRDKDEKKAEEIARNNISLLRVIECKSEIQNEDSFYKIYCIYNLNYKYLEDVLKRLFSRIKTYMDFTEPNIDISRDRIEILENLYSIEKANSVVALYPNIAKEWDVEKNGNIKPEYISVGSCKHKYWWKCPRGHSYEATVAIGYTGMVAHSVRAIRLYQGRMIC